MRVRELSGSHAYQTGMREADLPCPQFIHEALVHTLQSLSLGGVFARPFQGLPWFCSGPQLHLLTLRPLLLAILDLR